MDDRIRTQVDLVDDGFERLGRQAGAERRRPVRADGPGTVVKTAHRHREKVAVVVGVTAAVVVTGLLVANAPTRDEPAPFTTVPSNALPAVSRNPAFVGTWLSADTDGSSQTMEIVRSGGDGYRVVVRDDFDTACSGDPATMTGSGLVEADERLFIARPELTCDRRTTPSLGLPPRAELADLTFELDTVTDELVDRFGVVWRRASTLLIGAGGDDDTQTDTVASIPVTSTATTPPPTTPTPAAAASARDALAGRVGPGRYFVDPDGDDATPLRITFQVATDNMGSWFGWVKYLPGEADGFTGLSITTVTNLVSDGCEDHTALDPPVGPTVDDLATALSQLAPFEVTAPPTGVTLFGFQGKHLELTVPALPITGGAAASSSFNNAKFTDCVDGEIHSWISPINDRSWGLLAHSIAPFHGAFNAYQAPGQSEEFWILDVEGTRVVLVSFDTPNAPADDIAERDAIFDSIRIEP